MSKRLVRLHGFFWGVLFLCFPSGCSQKNLQEGSSSDQPSGESSQREGRTFTTSQDFSAAQMLGLNVDTSGEIQVNTGINVFETPFMWVPNSASRTVTKIDTIAKKVVGTYELGDCYSPSRTTVDKEGAVWLGCRGDSSYRDAPAPLPLVDNKVIKINRDGTIKYSIKVGNAPRAIAIDNKNQVWIGCSVDDTVWAVDNATGQILYGDGGSKGPALKVADFPYGAVVDMLDHLWLISSMIKGAHGKAVLQEIDTSTGKLIKKYGPYSRNGCANLYGIAVDRTNDIWLGGFECGDVLKVRGSRKANASEDDFREIYDGKLYQTGEMVGFIQGAGRRGRGVAVDLDNNVWAAFSADKAEDFGFAVKFNGVHMKAERSIQVGREPVGIGVDAYGNAWIVNKLSDSVDFISGVGRETVPAVSFASGKLPGEADDQPYSYSDMLGLSLRMISMPVDGVATWRGKIDSGLESPVWDNITWSARCPEGSQLQVRMRCAATEEALALLEDDEGFGTSLTEPGPTNCPQAGRWMEVELRFLLTGSSVRPSLQDLSVYWKKP